MPSLPLMPMLMPQLLVPSPLVVRSCVRNKQLLQLHRLFQPDPELRLVRPTPAPHATDAGGYGSEGKVHRQNLLLKQLAELLVLVLLTPPLAVQVEG